MNAAVSLGGIYYRAMDFDLAEKMFRDAALNDDGPAMYWLARIYMRENASDDKYSKIKALLEGAMAQGQVRAKNTLSFLLMSGRYGIKNIPRGVFLCIASLADAFRIGLHNPEDRRLL